jgi:putative transposase
MEKRPGGSILRHRSVFSDERMKAQQVAGLTGAVHGERGDDRVNPRNGSRERTWAARPVDDLVLALAIPDSSRTS